MRSLLKEFFSSPKAKRQRQKHEWIFSWSTSLLTKIFKSSSLRQKKEELCEYFSSITSNTVRFRSMTWRMGKWEYKTRKCKNCLHNRRHLPLMRYPCSFFIIVVDWRNHAHIFWHFLLLFLFTPQIMEPFFLENDLMGDTLALMAGNYFIPLTSLIYDIYAHILK